jgi:hypothetical protein
MKQEDKIRRYRLGLAQIPLLLILLVLAIAVPVATKLVQQRQETRRGAVGTQLKYVCDVKNYFSMTNCNESDTTKTVDTSQSDTDISRSCENTSNQAGVSSLKVECRLNPSFVPSPTPTSRPSALSCCDRCYFTGTPSCDLCPNGGENYQWQADYNDRKCCSASVCGTVPTVPAVERCYCDRGCVTGIGSYCKKSATEVPGWQACDMTYCPVPTVPAVERCYCDRGCVTGIGSYCKKSATEVPGWQACDMTYCPVPTVPGGGGGVNPTAVPPTAVPPTATPNCNYGTCGADGCGAGKRWVSGTGCPSWYTSPGCYTDTNGCAVPAEDAKFNGTITSWDTGVARRWMNGSVNCADNKGVTLTTTSGIVQWYTDANGGHFDVINNPQGQQQTVTLTLPASCGYGCGTWNVIDRGANLTGNTIVKTGTGCVATFTPQNTDWQSGVTWDITKTVVTAPTCSGLTLNGQAGNITAVVGATVNLASTVSNYGLISSAKVIAIGDRVADPRFATSIVRYPAGANPVGTFVPTEPGVYVFEVNAYDSSACNYLCSAGATLYKSSTANQCLTSGIWSSVGNCSATGCIRYVTVTAPTTMYSREDCDTVTGNYRCSASATGTYTSMSACETSSGCDIAATLYNRGNCNYTTGNYICNASATGTYASASACETSEGCDVQTNAGYNRGTCNTATGRYTCTAADNGTYATQTECESSSGDSCSVKYGPVAGSCNTATGNFTCAASATGAYTTEALCIAADGCDIAVSTDLVLKYRMAFAGLKPTAKCGVNWTSGLIVKSGTEQGTYTGIVPVKTTDVNSRGEAVFEVSQVLTGFTQKTAVAAFVKGMKHLQMKYGQNSQTGTYGKAGGELTLKTVGETGHTVYDFAGYPLLAGDVDQNGVINSVDFAMVKAKVSAYTQVSEGGYLLEDLDGSCQVNTADITLLVKSLDEKQAELY